MSIEPWVSAGGFHKWAHWQWDRRSFLLAHEMELEARAFQWECRLHHQGPPILDENEWVQMAIECCTLSG